MVNWMPPGWAGLGKRKLILKYPPITAGDYDLQYCHGSRQAGRPDLAIARTWDRVDIHPASLDMALPK